MSDLGDRGHGWRHGELPPWTAAIIGAVVGFAIGAALYGVLTPVLEASSWARDLQGFVWNLVPTGTVAGLVVGTWLSGRANS